LISTEPYDRHPSQLGRFRDRPHQVGRRTREPDPATDPPRRMPMRWLQGRDGPPALVCARRPSNSPGCVYTLRCASGRLICLAASVGRRPRNRHLYLGPPAIGLSLCGLPTPLIALPRNFGYVEPA
jgi:hypothetical protein